MINQTKLVIEPGRAEKNYFADLWRYRELFYILSWRDISTRYKQTFIGILWALIRPFLTMVVFTVVFGKLAKLPSDGGAPYAIMVYAALLPWQFFSSSLTEASNSLVGNAQLITKVYFPRMIIPTSSIITCFVDFLISFAILVMVMAYYRFMPTLNIFLLPVFLLMAFAASLGLGLYITSLNVKYRDFRYVIPFVVQFGLYISPVGFSSSIIPEQYRLLYCLNPMVAVIDGFRWAIIGNTTFIYWPGFILSMAVTFFFVLLGIKKFRSMEKSFADII
ncbi:MAG: ABC transporter permease [Deltaproteobacteria bacterium]|nr:ABC transporter permease [Deltaproteobacteria bacterium]